MDDNKRDSIMIKIKKLLALATSTNENEAAIAAAKAQELLMEYNISQEEIEGISLVKNEKVISVYVPPKGHNIKNWFVSLSNTVAKANLCKIITSGPSIVWIGKPTNIEVAQFITQTVAQDLDRFCEEKWELYNWFQRNNPTMGIVHGKTWKNNFYYGAIEVIRERLNANLVQLEANTNMLALVVRNDQDIKEFVDSKFGKLRSSHVNSAYNSEGRSAGRQAGQSIQFRSGLGAGGASGPRLIGKG